MKLIDKDALVANIDRRIKILQKNPYENHKTICHFDSLKQSLDTLEVKEVDLETEIDNISEKYRGLESLCEHDVIEICEHFFKFGAEWQKAQMMAEAVNGTTKFVGEGVEKMVKFVCGDLNPDEYGLNHKVKLIIIK